VGRGEKKDGKTKGKIQKHGRLASRGDGKTRHTSLLNKGFHRICKINPADEKKGGYRDSNRKLCRKGRTEKTKNKEVWGRPGKGT